MAPTRASSAATSTTPADCSRARVEFIISEHPPAIDAARERDYERIRRRLERLAGIRVRSRRYPEVGRLDGAAAVILSGSFAPWSDHDLAALARLGDAVTSYRGPVLGICAGMQLLTLFAGGAIEPRHRPQIGFGAIEVADDADLLSGLAPRTIAYMHHAEDVIALPDGFEVLARSEHCAVEAIAARNRRWWGTQFHPERFTAAYPAGARVLRNFLSLAVPSGLDNPPAEAYGRPPIESNGGGSAGCSTGAGNRHE